MSYYLNKLRKALNKLIWGWMLCFLVIISHVWHVRCCSCNSCLNLILFACLLKLAHDLHAYGCSVVTLCLSCLLFLMHCLLYLCAFIHMHYCTSFRYDRWTTWRTWYWNRTRRRCWWTYPEEAKNQEYMLGPEYSPSECHLTNTDLVLIPDKPQCTYYYLKLWHLYMYLLLVHYVSGVDRNSSCMIPRFPWIILACIGR